MRRYSKRQQYAIPYNGEEVYLHWANSDQYYIKTTQHFHNYEWKTPSGIHIRFEVCNADIEHDNIKGGKRFFLPLVKKARVDKNVVFIPFEYRPLTPSETKKHKKGSWLEIYVYR